MDELIVQKLLSLNREFYQTFATNFSLTRMRIQPGVRQILARISPDARIMDLGCGNGELAFALAEQGYQGKYLGIDFSAELLKIARERVSGHPQFNFFQSDLSEPDWYKMAGFDPKMEGVDEKYDFILAFAVLHHLPGGNLRIQTCRKINHLLVTGGRFIHSNWQFLKSDRMRRRIQSWDTLDLESKQVDPGDYLLDWRSGGRGLRYVHHFNQDELTSLATMTGFRIINWYLSDGEGGNLGLYQIWQKETSVA